MTADERLAADPAFRQQTFEMAWQKRVRTTSTRQQRRDADLVMAKALAADEAAGTGKAGRA